MTESGTTEGQTQDMLAGAEGAGAGEGTQDGGGKSWLDSLPEELRGDASLKEFKGPADAAKAYVNLYKKFGVPDEQILKIPAGEDGWDEVHAKIGRPESPEGYQLAQVAGAEQIDKEYLTSVLKGAHGAGISQRQMAKLYPAIVEADSAQAERIRAEDARIFSATENALKTEWGEQYESKRALAGRVAGKFLTEGTRNALKSAGLNNNLDFVKFFAQVGESMAEDSAFAGDGASGFGDPKAEYETLKQNPEYQKAIMNRDDPQHQAMLAKRDALIDRIYPKE